MRQHLWPRQPFTALLSVMRHSAERGTTKGKEREGQTATPWRTQTEPAQKRRECQWLTTWPKLFGHRQRVHAPHTGRESACRMIAPAMSSTLTMQLRTAVSTATIFLRRYYHRTRNWMSVYKRSYTKQGQPARLRRRSVRDVQSPSFHGETVSSIVRLVRWRQRKNNAGRDRSRNTGQITNTNSDALEPHFQGVWGFIPPTQKANPETLGITGLHNP